MAAFLALVLVVIVAAMPIALHGNTTPPWDQAAEKAAPISLVATPSITPVTLAKTAQPIEPEQPPAAAGTHDSARMAALVAGEDLRLRTLLHHISRLAYPEVVTGSGQYDVSSGVMSSGVSTLVLPGPANYTIADLQSAGAVVPLTQGGFLLVYSVLVGSGATLTIGGSSVPRLLMEASDTGFTSLVTWGGTLSLYGESPQSPLTIMSWNRKTNLPADDHRYGRPYIRAVGGKLDLRNVLASYLGFWSGRTGGVAWTGISSRASTGSATSSMFIGNTYGAFVSRSNHVEFLDDLFQQNELDGLRLHRSALNSTVVNSAAVRNGGNGFVVSRGATGSVLRGDLAIHNGSNGFLLNGQSLARGAGPDGGQTTSSVGTVLENSNAQNNARTGILLEGGSGTVIRANLVCGPVTGIAVRQGAIGTFIVGNEVRCGGRVALSIGPGVTGTTVAGNILTNARIGMLIRNSPGVRILNNRITGMSVFGISARGVSPGVVGTDNVIAGKGLQPIDTRAGASDPTMLRTDLTGWSHRSSVTLLTYLRYHPLITTWLIILVLVVLSTFVVRIKRSPARPYAFTMAWANAADGFAHHESELAPIVQSTPGVPIPVRPARRPRITPHPKRVPVAAMAANAVIWRPFGEYANQPGALTGSEPAVAPSSATQGEPSELKAAVAPLISRDPTPRPDKSAPTHFWNWLADGSWAGEQAMPGRVADQESPA
jgi:parallel beta-helix repeat protein